MYPNNFYLRVKKSLGKQDVFFVNTVTGNVELSSPSITVNTVAKLSRHLGSTIKLLFSKKRG